MLAGASLWLARQGYLVSVIGRNPNKMQRLTDQHPARITPVFVDYTDTEALADQIEQVQKENGQIELVLAWIHGTGRDVFSALIKSLSTKPWELFHVTGSSADLRKVKDKAAVPSHVQYYQIQLGFHIENGRSRWLTNQEISDGVVKAIEERKTEYVIGRVDPWEKRP